MASTSAREISAVEPYSERQQGIYSDSSTQRESCGLIQARTFVADYAAEHIHLAYASTVHGIQGETVHSSYVGPGVDAAGLYVGMTRGRHTNTAITIGRDADHAIDQLTDTMMRGRLEVTLDDARRASLSELGRAARASTQRSSDTLRGVRDRLETARAVVRAARARLREIDREITRAEAVSHARTIGPQPPSTTERAAIQIRIDDARHEIAALLQEHRERFVAPLHNSHQVASAADQEFQAESLVAPPVRDSSGGLGI